MTPNALTDRPLVALIYERLDMDGQATAESIADAIEDLYELTPRTRPTDERIGDMCSVAIHSNGVITGAEFRRLLAEDGYEIRRVGGTE